MFSVSFNGFSEPESGKRWEHLTGTGNTRAALQTQPAVRYGLKWLPTASSSSKEARRPLAPPGLPHDSSQKMLIRAFGTFSAAVLCIYFVSMCTWPQSSERLQMAIPLSSTSRLSGESADYGYLSAEVGTKAFSEIHRALNDADMIPSTPLQKSTDIVVNLKNNSQHSYAPVTEISVFDRVLPDISAFCLSLYCSIIFLPRITFVHSGLIQEGIVVSSKTLRRFDLMP